MKLHQPERRPNRPLATTVLQERVPLPKLPSFEAERDLRPEDFELLAQPIFGHDVTPMNLAMADLAFPGKLSDRSTDISNIKKRLLSDVGMVNVTWNRWPDALAVGLLQQEFPPGLVKAWGLKAWKDTKKDLSRSPSNFQNFLEHLPGLIGILLLLPEKRDEVEIIFKKFESFAENDLLTHVGPKADNLMHQSFHGLLSLVYPEIREKMDIPAEVWSKAKKDLEDDRGNFPPGSPHSTSMHIGAFQDRVFNLLLLGHPEARIENGRIVLNPEPRSGSLTHTRPLPERPLSA